MNEKLYGKLEPLDEAYERGYRAGVEAMRDACKTERVLRRSFDEIAARLLEEKP